MWTEAQGNSGGGEQMKITKIETAKAINTTTRIDCTQIENYRDLTADDFFLDIVRMYSGAIGYKYVTKSYDASTGVLTISRESGLEPTCNIYCVG